VLEIRGDLTEAEEAYARAARYGHEPQPGLALLWLAQGRTSAAVAAVHRLTVEPRPDVLRVALLTAAIEILLAADAVADAATLSRDLDRCAALLDTPLVRGRAGHATGAVLLAQGQADQALPRVRQAITDFAGVTVACSRMLLCQVYAALDDPASATLELTEAATALDRLGARPTRQQVTRLLRPDRPGGLTCRELEVLRLVAAVTNNAGIAAALVLSETVTRHLSTSSASSASPRGPPRPPWVRARPGLTRSGRPRGL
jgi:ATP/maltotriose-dependent transcriptional regulator MalT